jgi:phage gpG-like protein
MTPEELVEKMKHLSEDMRKDCAEIIAETAVTYYKNAFREKAFDGKGWRRTNKKTGSTLIESSNLMNSIRPIEITADRVVIAAGNEKVAYARVHNEGGVQYIKPHHRTWSRTGKRFQVQSYTQKHWKRQFMGNSKEMFAQINKKIDSYIKSQIN